MKKNELIKKAHEVVTSGVDWYFAEAFINYVKRELVNHLDKEGLEKLIKYFEDVDKNDDRL
jgi:ATP-dependent exoDNAse (exonuclease V) alpha subunit